MVLAEQFAGRAETADYFHGCGRGFSTPAEEFRWLIFFKGVPLVVLAVRAVFPAELSVLFRVFHYRFIRNDHEGKGMPRYLIDLVIFPQPQKKAYGDRVFRVQSPERRYRWREQVCGPQNEVGGHGFTIYPKENHPPFLMPWFSRADHGMAGVSKGRKFHEMAGNAALHPDPPEKSFPFLLQLHAGRKEHRLKRVIAPHEPLARIHPGQLHDPLPAPVTPGCTFPAVRNEVCALPYT